MARSQNLEALVQKNIWGQKDAKFGTISDNFDEFDR